VAGMGMMCQLEATLVRAGLGGAELRRTASLMMAAYPLGYIAMFTLLGAWDGWVLRPWRLWALQLGMIVGSAGLAALSLAAVPPVWALMACAALVGSGFGATYVGSIYYSLRLPDGASRAAGLHEMCIGIGNTFGPVAAGAFVAWWSAGVEGASSRALSGLGVYMAIAVTVTLLWQAARFPRVMRAT
jgi:MFS family permease